MRCSCAMTQDGISELAICKMYLFVLPHVALAAQTQFI